MSNEYYIWIMGRISCDKWHGLKSVTRERGDKLVAKFSKKYPENRYWLEPVEGADDIEFFLDCADNLVRWSLQPVVFALPPGECAHVLPEESCIFCQPHGDERELI